MSDLSGDMMKEERKKGELVYQSKLIKPGFLWSFLELNQ